MIHALAAAAVIAAGAPDYPALMQSLHVPGMQIVVVDHGKVVHNDAYGVKDTDTKAPVDVHTRFEIGSITKQFTAAAILQLQERHKLSLDDKVGKYVPQYPQGRNITLRQLLEQTSGIPDYLDAPGFRTAIVRGNGVYVVTRPGSLANVLALIKDRKLDFAPGTKWAYSNTNYYLLGSIIERVSGQSWSAYIARHIFAPAHMSESSFMEDEQRLADVATGYAQRGEKIYRGTPAVGWAVAAGGIVSTARDLAKWDEALFSGKIISAASLKTMTTPSALPAFNDRSHYAFGWVVDTYDGQPRVWHNGGTFGFNASNQIYPAQRQRIIVLANIDGGSTDTIADKTFEALDPQYAGFENRAVAGEYPAVTARAKAVYDQIVQGSVDRSQFTARMNAQLTDATIASVKSQLAAAGPPTSWVYKGKSVNGGDTTYTYLLTYAGGMSLHAVMTVQPDGKIGGYLLSP